MKKNNRFSNIDLELLDNAKIIEDKNRVLKSIEHQFTQLGNSVSSEYKLLLENSPPPKVSKGENYKNYPFRILDYPRIFEAKNIFAFRTLFWWGKYISFTLHLKGSYLRNNYSTLIKLTSQFNEPLVYSNDGDEWNHDLNEKNYGKFDLNRFKAIPYLDLPFLKIVQQIPINQINELANIYDDFFNGLILPLHYDRNKY